MVAMADVEKPDIDVPSDPATAKPTEDSTVAEKKTNLNLNLKTSVGNGKENDRNMKGK